MSGVTVWLMSDGELSRLEVLRDLDQKRLTTEAAAQLLGLERRQVFRLLKAYRTEGPTGLISKRRGRRSNRRKPEPLRKVVLAIVCQWYWDFGPTLAAEKLREDHGIAVGRETLRQWHLQFVESESTFAYFHAARAYLEAWGKPVAFIPTSTSSAPIRARLKGGSNVPTRRCRTAW